LGTEEMVGLAEAVASKTLATHSAAQEKVGKETTAEDRWPLACLVAAVVLERLAAVGLEPLAALAEVAHNHQSQVRLRFMQAAAAADVLAQAGLLALEEVAAAEMDLRQTQTLQGQQILAVVEAVEVLL